MGHVCWQKLLLSRSLLSITCTPRLVFPPLMLLHSVVIILTVSLPPKPRIVSLLMSAPASCLMPWPLRSLPWITCIPRTQLLRLMLMHSVVTTSLVTLLLKLRHPRRKPVLNRKSLESLAAAVKGANLPSAKSTKLSSADGDFTEKKKSPSSVNLFGLGEAF